ncbi:gas vesicle protein [Streptomyces albus subsp. chlorinus]|uniref:gas vesicle protein GvpO n=1 Tax=Streptomyces albus TaxID=1888 RepID=UPI00156EB0B4|nr:gas vesicle protein GvpO [Streptomyces albus]NSC23835.1 gas vesicle protein [Streptomyces albus subsp. chlorinus]
MPEQRDRRTRTATKSASSSKRSASGSSGGSSVRGPEDAARRACRGLDRLIGHRTEGISAVRRAEEGWRVHVDVLEVPRIPDTTSLLATYEVELDGRGELTQYRRIRRYRRGASDD